MLQYSKNKSNWVENINIQPETIKLLEKHTGENFLRWVLAMILWIELKHSNKIKNRWKYIAEKASAQKEKKKKEKASYRMG